MFLFELEEIHSKCGTHYEMWLERGIFFVYCSACDKSWEPCKSAFRQYREQAEDFVNQINTRLEKPPDTN